MSGFQVGEWVKGLGFTATVLQLQGLGLGVTNLQSG